MELNKVKEQIANMRFSFSRLKSFDNCKYEWLLKYTDECKEDGDDNFFAQYGKLMHEIIEKYAKNELSIFEVEDYYVEHFNEITYYAPTYNTYLSYFQKGLAYCRSLFDLSLDMYDVVDVEKEVKFEINGRPFVGYIDLILRDKNTGKLIMVDHKSESIKFLKNGSVSKTCSDSITKFKRQMYLYSIGLHNEYNEYPTMYSVNLFNVQKQYTFEFNENELNESIEWASNLLKAIENETEFKPNYSFYYCNHMCEYRNFGLECCNQNEEKKEV